MNKNIFKLLVVALFICTTTTAQGKKETFLFKAMQDELGRNMKELSLPGVEHPFFMEYVVVEGKRLVLDATLGSVKSVYESPSARGTYARVLVGDYHRTNTMNYETQVLADPGITGLNTTIDDNYNQLRRDLWRQTDIAYKKAIEEYSKKNAVQSQKALSKEEDSLDDFSKEKPAQRFLPDNNIVMDRSKMSRLVEDLSAIFKQYPDIENSEVILKMAANKVFCVNSEGSRYSFPNNVVVINVKALELTSDGKTLSDDLEICSLQEKDLPTVDQLKARIADFAEKFVRMKTAKAIKDYYSGPVLFEKDAVATLFDSELFSQTGVFSTRQPVEGEGDATLQEKMNCKVISNEFTVKCLPFLKEYKDQKLAGWFEMDMDGIAPAKELTLIDNGTLKNLIGNRMPSKYNSYSSGYFRSGSHQFQTQKMLAPGNVDITTNRGISNDSLKALLLKSARESGYQYAYIVRKLDVRQTMVAMNYYPTRLFRVNVADGREEPIIDAEIRDFRKGILKLVLGASNNKIAINTLFAGNIPMSYICPDAILLPDLEIAWRKDSQKIALPVVSSPLKEIK